MFCLVVVVGVVVVPVVDVLQGVAAEMEPVFATENVFITSVKTTLFHFFSSFLAIHFSK